MGAKDAVEQGNITLNAVKLYAGSQGKVYFPTEELAKKNKEVQIKPDQVLMVVGGSTFEMVSVQEINEFLGQELGTKAIIGVNGEKTVMDILYRMQSDQFKEELVRVWSNDNAKINNKELKGKVRKYIEDSLEKKLQNELSNEFLVRDNHLSKLVKVGLEDIDGNVVTLTSNYRPELTYQQGVIEYLKGSDTYEKVKRDIIAGKLTPFGDNTNEFIQDIKGYALRTSEKVFGAWEQLLEIDGGSDMSALQQRVVDLGMEMQREELISDSDNSDEKLKAEVKVAFRNQIATLSVPEFEWEIKYQLLNSQPELIIQALFDQYGLRVRELTQSIKNGVNIKLHNFSGEELADLMTDRAIEQEGMQAFIEKDGENVVVNQAAVLGYIDSPQGDKLLSNQLLNSKNYDIVFDEATIEGIREAADEEQ